MFKQESNFLVCDDSLLSRAVIIKELKEAGFTNILEAENGEMAHNIIVESAEDEGKTIDLLFLDMNMPVLDGLGLVAKLKANPKFEELPIIMISAEADSDLVIKAIAMNISHYLVKPVAPGDVLAKMKAVWDSNN